MLASFWEHSPSQANFDPMRVTALPLFSHEVLAGDGTDTSHRPGVEPQLLPK